MFGQRSPLRAASSSSLEISPRIHIAMKRWAFVSLVVGTVMTVPFYVGSPMAGDNLDTVGAGGESPTLRDNIQPDTPNVSLSGIRAVGAVLDRNHMVSAQGDNKARLHRGHLLSMLVAEPVRASSGPDPNKHLSFVGGVENYGGREETFFKP